MLFLKRIPRLIRWLLAVLLVFLMTMTFYRFFFYLHYNPAGKAFSGSAFLMGLRFDIKFACMLILSILLLCTVPFLNPFKNVAAKKIWDIILPLVFVLVLFCYVADYYNYDYTQQRLNGSVLSYVHDAGISATMAWQTYPVLTIVFGLIVLAVLARISFGKLLTRFQREEKLYKGKEIGWHIFFFLLFAWGVFGKVGQFPLRWSDAFTLSDNFKANVALNPFQSFFSSLKFRDSGPDIKKVRSAYPLMATYLGVQQPDSTRLNFERNYSFPDPPHKGNPNVVLVICESFSMYKSSMSGNPLNTTPFFNELCNAGVFYDRCFTPAYSTARGVWATVTGIPDVLGNNNRTASRNPEIVNQHTIINDFKQYDKFYFLGGDPTWANIKGLLINNINGLHLYSQEDYKAKKVDVWGIDDVNLFLEANQVLAKQQQPFFAIIQTADNHRPYTIPEENLNLFKKVNFPKDSLEKYGFATNDELNAFRYTDFGYQRFIEAAKKEKYFDNTIFIFVGDHGIKGNAAALYPKSFTENSLTSEHVPLLFYAPKLVQPKRVHAVASQVDILPSIAGFLKIPYRNNAMGQNLFDSTSAAARKEVFVIDHEAFTIGMVTDQYYCVRNLKSGKREMVSVADNEPVTRSSQTDSTRNYLERLTDAYYETAKYLLYNNKQ